MELYGYSLKVNSTLLFEDVYTVFYRGEINHLLGSNGVGKSCLAKSFHDNNFKGTIKDAGKICIIGSYTNIPGDLKLNDILHIISRNGSNNNLYENLKKRLEIDSIEKNKCCKYLSDGQRQRIKLLCFLLDEPDTLVLDEFTTALDKRTMIELYTFLSEYIREQQITLINITHNLVDLEYLKGRYYHIENKKIVNYENKDDLINAYIKL